MRRSRIGSGKTLAGIMLCAAVAERQHDEEADPPEYEIERGLRGDRHRSDPVYEDFDGRLLAPGIADLGAHCTAQRLGESCLVGATLRIETPYNSLDRFGGDDSDYG